MLGTIALSWYICLLWRFEIYTPYKGKSILLGPNNVISCHFQMNNHISLLVLCCYLRILLLWYSLSNLKEITSPPPLKVVFKHKRNYPVIYNINMCIFNDCIVDKVFFSWILLDTIKQTFISLWHWLARYHISNVMLTVWFSLVTSKWPKTFVVVNMISGHRHGAISSQPLLFWPALTVVPCAA